jgi:RNA polymerase sigma factor (TIGR02999 family)
MIGSSISGAGLMHSHPSDITGLLARWQQGDSGALNDLAPVIRRELIRLARRQLSREGHRNSIQASSLVQEVFLRLLPARDVDWRSRAHFFAVASQVMRRILVDHARERNCVKRGGDIVHVPADEAAILSELQLDEVVALGLALERLAKKDMRKSKVFEMRFFGGLSVEETAEALGVAPNTVIRDWNFARAWLRCELGGKGATCRG